MFSIVIDAEIRVFQQYLRNRDARAAAKSRQAISDCEGDVACAVLSFATIGSRTLVLEESGQTERIRLLLD